MPLFRRYEGTVVKTASVERRIMPFLMPRRSEALVLTSFQLDPIPAQRYLDQLNQGRAKPLSLFTLMLCAMARALSLRPKMNRFFIGGRIYQRKWLDVSFSLKIEKTEKSSIRVMKVRFEPTDTVETFTARVQAAIERGRSSEATADEKEMKLALLLPTFLLRLGVWLLKWLDSHNLMPAAMIRSDPLYTSLVVANLGSLGMPAPYHHLYEWGTSPLFCAVGKTEKMPVVEGDRVVAKELVPFTVSYDERCIDGLYAGKAIDLFKQFMTDPVQLESALGVDNEEPKQAANS